MSTDQHTQGDQHDDRTHGAGADPLAASLSAALERSGSAQRVEIDDEELALAATAGFDALPPDRRVTVAEAIAADSDTGSVIASLAAVGLLPPEVEETPVSVAGAGRSNRRMRLIGPASLAAAAAVALAVGLLPGPLGGEEPLPIPGQGFNKPAGIDFENTSDRPGDAGGLVQGWLDTVLSIVGGVGLLTAGAWAASRVDGHGRA